MTTWVDVRPYMYETLMLLVGVHAQVTGVAPPLLERTFHAIIEELFAAALQCFRQIPRLSMGGMHCVCSCLYLTCRLLMAVCT